MIDDITKYDAARDRLTAALRERRKEAATAARWVRNAEKQLAKLGAGLSVNAEQRLYVIRSAWPDDYVTCLGFDVAETRLAHICAWLGVAVPEGEVGTVARYRQYTRHVAMAHEKFLATGERCPAELTPELVGLEGKRVEVTYSWGETERFIVGRSTGWMPCHLVIKTRSSSGGRAVVGSPFQKLTVIDHNPR